MRVVAFVGESGTGKSHRAFLVANRYKAQAIIDDGLLIVGGKIIAGYSAKNEPNMIRAVKRAIFKDEKHVRDVKEALHNMKIKSILILGTSEKMVSQIVESLSLTPPETVVHIESVASAVEIEEARKLRSEGKHIIPVPVVELRSHFFDSLVDKARIFIKQRKNKLISTAEFDVESSKTSKEEVNNDFAVNLKDKKYAVKNWVEKSIVRPKFSYVGRLIVSDELIVDLCEKIALNDEVMKVFDIRVKKEEGQVINLQLSICIRYGKSLKKTAERLQQDIKEKVSYLTGMIVSQVDVHIAQIKIEG